MAILKAKKVKSNQKKGPQKAHNLTIQKAKSLILL